MPNLITVEFATEQLGSILPPEAMASIDRLVALGSRAVERYCKYPLAARDWARVVRPNRNRTERLWAPIRRMDRVAAGAADALYVVNADPACPRASIRLAPTEEEIASKVDFGTVGAYTPARLILRAFRSGAWQEDEIALADNPTIGSLADAANAIGGGWEASVAGNFGDWPSEDLVAAQDAVPSAANMGRPGSALYHYPTDLDGWQVDPGSGIITFPMWSHWGRPGACTFYLRWRAGYEADAMPEDIQEAVIQTIKSNADLMATNLAMQSETIADYTYAKKSGPAAGWVVPDLARGLLATYRGRSIKF